VIGAIATVFARAIGRFRVFTASENITRLFIDYRKSIRRFTTIVKNYKCLHSLGH
jgi:hypothetical protein